MRQAANESMQADLWARSSDDSQFPSLELFADHNIHAEQLDIDTSRAQPNVIVANGESNNSLGCLTTTPLQLKSPCTATISAKAKPINLASSKFKTSN